ncbi:hypothetical protein F511_39547 [Dorcoceras hygrometricum]|uniref:Uncharacterized protein n=1 Tax=Dorcoceras hygrometricum TaxID=472368 RepID=A0A2Z7AQF5_9LAMI|nr:hypothetical protein F511_39547 [Dorcoceras hygrometricum]
MPELRRSGGATRKITRQPHDARPRAIHRMSPDQRRRTSADHRTTAARPRRNVPRRAAPDQRRNACAGGGRITRPAQSPSAPAAAAASGGTAVWPSEVLIPRSTVQEEVWFWIVWFRSTTGNVIPPSICTRRSDGFWHERILLVTLIETSLITITGGGGAWRWPAAT